MEPKDAIRLLAAGSQSSVRRAFGPYVQDVPDVNLVGTAQDGAEAVLLYQDVQPDVVGMGTNMAVLHGINATELLTFLYPQAKVFMLAIGPDEDDLDQYREAGALGHLELPAAQDEFLDIVRESAARPALAADVPTSAGLREGVDPVTLRVCLQAARWVGALLGYGRTRLHQLPLVRKALRQGHIGGRSWFEFAAPILNKIIHDFEVCRQELHAGKDERLWFRRIDSMPTSLRSPPRRLIRYRWLLVPAYRQFVRVIERLHLIDFHMARVREGSLAPEPIRRALLQEVLEIEADLRWINHSARVTAMALSMWVKYRFEQS